MKAIRLLHRWIGLTLSLIVMAIALSGGILIFHDAALRYSWPSLAEPINPDQEHSYPTVLTDLTHRITDASIRLIRFPVHGKNTFQLWLSDDSKALVHPISGEVITRWTWEESLLDILFELHVHLFAGEIGEQVNGIVGILVLYLVASGISLWWPRRKKWRVQSIVPRHPSSLHFMRSHAVLGVLFSVPIIVIVATGITMVFNKPVVKVITSLVDSTNPTRPSASVTPIDQPIQSWQSILASVNKVLPTGQIRSVSLPDKDNGVLTVRKRMPGEWHPNGRSFVLINPYTGEILQTIDARKQKLGMRVTQNFYPIHASKVGGFPYAMLTFGTSISLLILAGFGFASYGIRMFAKRRKFQSATRASPMSSH